MNDAIASELVAVASETVATPPEALSAVAYRSDVNSVVSVCVSVAGSGVLAR
ncbi:MAG: hypothetical protein QOH20_514, partial [Mycobacterium sp.]|nr:hypothetical protein [Mycobacterium sp.]